MALAILPTAIAHSRVCQDPSQTLFWTGLVIYLSLLGLKERTRARVYLGGVLLLFPVALWTHPTNVFIGPFLVLPCLAALSPLLPSSRRGPTMLVAAAALLVALALLAAWFTFRHLAGSTEYLDKPWLSMAATRLLDGAQWFELATNGARLFNGVTIYHYFSGARPATGPYDVAAVVVIGSLVWRAPPEARLRTIPARLRPGRRVRGHVVPLLRVRRPAGAPAARGAMGTLPHRARHAGSGAGADGLDRWRPTRQWWPIASAAVVATSLLASFYVNYFHEFATTGGRSHLTYVTAAIEPKRQALDHVLDRRPGPGPRPGRDRTVVARLADRLPRHGAPPRVREAGS